MRHALMIAAAVLAASAARAGSVVYAYPSLHAKLTVHTVDGAAAPEALSYEGPKGFYLITASELQSFEHGDGYSSIRYNIRALSAKGFLRQEASYDGSEPCLFAKDDCVAAVERTIDELGAGKQEAPDEFAARVRVLRQRVEKDQSSWRAFKTEASSVGILDEAALDAAAKPLAEAASAVKSAYDQRVAGEYRAAAAAPTDADPNPKADFYWRQSLSLDAAEAALTGVETTLGSERIPRY